MKRRYSLHSLAQPARAAVHRLLRSAAAATLLFSSPTSPAATAQELTLLTERLGRLNEDLTRKLTARNEYDAVIGETEAAYMKVRRRRRRRRRIAQCAHLASSTTPHLSPPPTSDSQILESSQTLLSVLKREAVSLSKRTAGPL